MKESVSVTTIFQIVILFILLFTAIMCLTINNSNAFGVRDEIINIIEMNNGNYLSDDNSGYLSEEIVDAISAAAYRTTGVCDAEYTGFERNGQPVGSGDLASVCIREVSVTDGIDSYLDELLGDTVDAEFVEGKYYQIVLFYQLDLPVMRQVYNFQTKGETKIIYEETRSVNTSGSTSSNNGTLSDIFGNNSNNNTSTETGNNNSSGNNNETNNGNNIMGEQLACREGLVESDLISGIQGVAMAVVPIYPSLNDTNNTRSTRLDGTKFSILGNDGTANGGGRWAIMYDGECGWVDSTYMAIDATDYLPSNVKFNITNASSSAYYAWDGTSDVWIPNLTGKRLYDSSQYNNSFVPLTFSFAQSLRNIAQSNSNRQFLINDAYRPYSVTVLARNSLSSLISSNSNVLNVGMSGWGTGWFLAQGVSAHNTGCAVDITFADLSTEQIRNMPSAMHDLSKRAAIYTYSGSGTYSTEFTNSQASTLHSIMTAGGLDDLASEWWHYQSDSCYNTIRSHSSTNGGQNISFYDL